MQALSNQKYRELQEQFGDVGLMTGACCAVLRCAALCCAVLRCAALRFAELHCAVPCCAALHHAVPRFFAVLCHALLGRQDSPPGGPHKLLPLDPCAGDVTINPNASCLVSCRHVGCIAASPVTIC